MSINDKRANLSAAVSSVADDIRAGNVPDKSSLNVALTDYSRQVGSDFGNKTPDTGRYDWFSAKEQVTVEGMGNIESVVKGPTPFPTYGDYTGVPGLNLKYVLPQLSEENQEFPPEYASILGGNLYSNNPTYFYWEVFNRTHIDNGDGYLSNAGDGADQYIGVKFTKPVPVDRVLIKRLRADHWSSDLMYVDILDENDDIIYTETFDGLTGIEPFFWVIPEKYKGGVCSIRARGHTRRYLSIARFDPMILA